MNRSRSLIMDVTALPSADDTSFIAATTSRSRPTMELSRAGRDAEARDSNQTLVNADR